MTGVGDTPNVMSDPEYTLWEDFHDGYSSHVACDRKALAELFPKLIPDNLRRSAKLVAVSREVIWKALTGKDYKKLDWNK